MLMWFSFDKQHVERSQRKMLVYEVHFHARSGELEGGTKNRNKEFWIFSSKTSGEGTEI